MKDKITIIVSKITKEITGKNIILDSDKGLLQTSDSIYADHYLEVLHELSHFIAATPKERKTYNLGLATDISEPETRENVIQEIKACEINQHFNKLFFEFMDDYELRYSEYICNANRSGLCEKFNLNKNEFCKDILNSAEFKKAIKYLKKSVSKIKALSIE